MVCVSAYDDTFTLADSWAVLKACWKDLKRSDGFILNGGCINIETPPTDSSPGGWNTHLNILGEVEGQLLPYGLGKFRTWLKQEWLSLLVEHHAGGSTWCEVAHNARHPGYRFGQSAFYTLKRERSSWASLTAEQVVELVTTLHRQRATDFFGSWRGKERKAARAAARAKKKSKRTAATTVNDSPQTAQDPSRAPASTTT